MSQKNVVMDGFWDKLSAPYCFLRALHGQLDGESQFWVL